jgi:transposase-like protein
MPGEFMPVSQYIAGKKKLARGQHHATRSGYAMTSRATPEAAKRLWDEAVAARVKPSLREIARRLGVAPSTVMRWKRNDWVENERRYLPPSNLAVEARVSEVVEKTNQTSGKVKPDELKEAIAALVGGKDELTKLLVAPAQELLEELERLNLVTMIAAQHMVQG